MESQDDWNVDDILNLDQHEMIQRDRVFLKNLPAELVDDGIKHMCEEYGTVRDVHRPNDQNYAFVTFASAAEAQNLLRRINDDFGALKIIAEHARVRQPNQRLTSNSLDFLNDRPAVANSNEPLRNVLELSKRKIQGPFGDPTEMHAADSLISPKDYSSRNLLLKCADPSKEFLWNSNDEISVDCEFKEYRKQIVHGRAIFLKSNENNNHSEATGQPDKKTFSFNSHLISSIKYCANCSRPADKNCKNCQSPQCSLECHAAACKKANSNDEQIQDKVMASKIEKQPIKNTVKITAVLNHRLVFLRPATESDDIAFARLNCDTVRYAKDAKVLTCLPQVGLLVLAKFDFYQRALVLKHLSSTTVAVIFIDYGNVETRDFHELKIMPDKLKKIKRFASKFELNKIDHDIMNFAALKVLYRYMATETELRMEINETNHCVNLKASDKWINELVNQRNALNIKRQAVSSFADRLFLNDVPHKPIETIEKMCGKEVIILDNSLIALNDLTFIDVDDLKLFRENDRRVQSICNYLFEKDELYTPLKNLFPRNNEVCVIKYTNGRWYRVECVEVVHDGFATMQFIDFGNVKPIEINDIRRIPEALLFECISIIADCFSHSSIDLTNIEKCNELKDQYPKQSRHKIQRINVETTTDEVNRQSIATFAWLEKM